MTLISGICFTTIFVVSSVISVNNLIEEFSWTRIDYDWANESSNYRSRPHNTGVTTHHNHGRSGSTSRSQKRENYVYQNNIPMGANVWRDKLFITVPRRRHGIPSSLNYVSLNSKNKHNTPLIPYPNWDMNVLPENYNSTNFCNASLNLSERGRFVSIYRMAVDTCDRLWFVDTGVLENPGAPIRVHAAKLVIMDLRTDTVLKQYTFPESVKRPRTVFTHVVVDTDSNSCNEAYAYLPDLAGYGLIVYSLRQNKSWRVTHNYFYLEPTRGEFNIAGYQFQWTDGVFSTALGPLINGRRHLYFHSMAGTNLYRVSTAILKNETAATRSYHHHDFELLGDRGDGSQTSASALDVPSEVLFLNLVNQNALACWNINSPLSDIDIIQRDEQRMIYPSDLKIYNGSIYVLTNTMPAFVFGQLNYDVTNFRVWVQNVHQAIQGTRCANGSGNGYSGISQGYRRSGWGHHNTKVDSNNEKRNSEHRGWK